MCPQVVAIPESHPSQDINPQTYDHDIAPEFNFSADNNPINLECRYAVAMSDYSVQADNAGLTSRAGLARLHVQYPIATDRKHVMRRIHDCQP